MTERVRVSLDIDTSLMASIMRIARETHEPVQSWVDKALRDELFIQEMIADGYEMQFVKDRIVESVYWETENENS